MLLTNLRIWLNSRKLIFEFSLTQSFTIHSKKVILGAQILEQSPVQKWICHSIVLLLRKSLTSYTEHDSMCGVMVCGHLRWLLRYYLVKWQSAYNIKWESSINLWQVSVPLQFGNVKRAEIYPLVTFSIFMCSVISCGSVPLSKLFLNLIGFISGHS